MCNIVLDYRIEMCNIVLDYRIEMCNIVLDYRIEMCNIVLDYGIEMCNIVLDYRIGMCNIVLDYGIEKLHRNMPCITEQCLKEKQIITTLYIALRVIYVSTRGLFNLLLGV